MMESPHPILTVLLIERQTKVINRPARSTLLAAPGCVTTRSPPPHMRSFTPGCYSLFAVLHTTTATTDYTSRQARCNSPDVPGNPRAICHLFSMHGTMAPSHKCHRLERDTRASERHRTSVTSRAPGHADVESSPSPRGYQDSTNPTDTEGQPATKRVKRTALTRNACTKCRAAKAKVSLNCHLSFPNSLIEAFRSFCCSESRRSVAERSLTVE
jgi:hypothetical protein